MSVFVLPALRNILNEDVINKLLLPDSTAPECFFNGFLLQTVSVEWGVKLVQKKAFDYTAMILETGSYVRVYFIGNFCQNFNENPIL